MATSFEHKLVKIHECISDSCNSSVRIFDRKKGHSSRSVGFAAYEERQQRLREIAEDFPDIIEFLCQKGGHNYFKFEGKTIKIISSTREHLNRNVFEKNAFEKSDTLENFDPLLRIIYSADYDLEDNVASILECHYLEIDRRTEQVLREVNILDLVDSTDGYAIELKDKSADVVELFPAGLQPKEADAATKDDEQE